MKLIVGLGNPGDKYKLTRHNIGFMVLDRLADHFSVPFTNESRFQSDVASATSANQQALLVKPQTFMNLMGEAVSALASYYQIAPEDIWVVSDDLDLPLGYIRVRHDGQSGGHNGLNAIINTLGSSDFWRIRLGIGPSLPRLEEREGVRRADADAYVLQPFHQQEQALRDNVITKATNVITKDLEQAKLIRHTYKLLDPAP